MHRQGNEAADRAAKAAVAHFARLFPLGEDLQHHIQHTASVGHVYQYLPALQTARAHLFQAKEADEPLGTRETSWTKQIASLIAWEPHNPDVMRQLNDLPREPLQYFLWGTRYGTQLLDWMAGVHWPQHPDPCNAGVTWFELCWSFQWYTQEGIVVNQGGRRADFKPVRLSLLDPDTPYAAQVLSFERAITSLQKLLQFQHMPDHRVTATSLRYFGASHGKGGFKLRCSFPGQHVWGPLITTHCQLLTPPKTLAEPPQIPVRELDRTWQPDDSDQRDFNEGWAHRVSRHRQYMSRITGRPYTGG
eukprot:Skav233233  [mRNA]  locus=scaffold1215:414473:415384:+ [translate_table: standard]